MKFKSKPDMWFNLLVAFMVVVTAYVFISAITTGTKGLYVSGGILLLMDTMYIVPVYFLTCYEISGDTLHIKSGYAFKKKIKIQDIVAVAPTHNPVSSAVQSANRIALFYKKGERVANEYISPERKREFITELTRINPEITVKEGIW